MESSLSTFLNIYHPREFFSEESFAVAVLERARQIMLENKLVAYAAERLETGTPETQIEQGLGLIVETSGNQEV